MCSPDHFLVGDLINPWMGGVVDKELVKSLNFFILNENKNKIKNMFCMKQPIYSGLCSSARINSQLTDTKVPLR